MDEQKALLKKESLLEILKKAESLLIAFSGGVDSTFLLASAREALGKKLIAVTSKSPVHPIAETRAAEAFCRKMEISHILMDAHEMSSEDFSRNNTNRCYHCKKIMMQRLYEIADKHKLQHVAHGANIDDLNDFRPGFKAAAEAGALAPLMDANLTKKEIRFLSRKMGLETWNKPSMACLASRIPYGEKISKIKLEMIESAESFLAGCGFENFRVRHHGSVARIEVSGNDFKKILNKNVRADISDTLRDIGFHHIALDLEGYVTGKMNRDILHQKDKQGKTDDYPE